jgi:hypothetical protein
LLFRQVSPALLFALTLKQKSPAEAGQLVETQAAVGKAACVQPFIIHALRFLFFQISLIT